MCTDEGGWTVLQKRKNGSENFELPWKSYENGFGASDSEFWLGLHRIYRIVIEQEQVLRVDLESWDNDHGYTMYDRFIIGSAVENYKLTIGVYSGKLFIC